MALLIVLRRSTIPHFTDKDNWCISVNVQEVFMPLIYCVEDDESIRELVSYALRGQGYKVEGFGDANALYDALQKNIPDMLLLDIMLPGEDGLTILKKMRAPGSGAMQTVPIIMMTAKTSEFDIVKGLDCGADDYVTKPFGIMELLSRIRSVLRRTKKRRRRIRSCSLTVISSWIRSSMSSQQTEKRSN